LLRRVEDRFPSQRYVHLEVGFDRSSAMSEDRFRELVRAHGFALTELAYQLHREPPLLEYRTVIWSSSSGGVRALEQSLLAEPSVVRFRLAPSRD
jgi:hypothetical protein